jgi:cytoskeleton protein RodZ
MRIGEVLKRTRTRQGLEIAEVEERTKIRTKYLRALENEEWDVLPTPAYARGFLRTYAQMLGLDADALSDEFRRQVETELPDHPYTFHEPVLERRRRPLGGEPRGPGRWLLAGVGILALLAALLVIGVVGGDDEGGREDERLTKREREQRQERKKQRSEQRQERREATREAREAQEVTLRLELNSDVQVCLLGRGSEQPLIDDQLLSAGSKEGPYEAPSFQLRFPFGYDRGQFDLFLNGDRRRLPETQGSTAYRITPPAKVEPAKATQRCP